MSSPAWKVVSEIADGYTTLSPAFLKRYQEPELNSLNVELERQTREVRSQVLAADDVEGVQKKNRKLLRLSAAAQVLSAYRSRAGKGAR